MLFIAFILIRVFHCAVYESTLCCSVAHEKTIATTGIWLLSVAMVVTPNRKELLNFFFGLAVCYSLINFTASWARQASYPLTSCLLFVLSAAGADFASGLRELRACRRWHDRKGLVQPLRQACFGVGLGG